MISVIIPNYNHSLYLKQRIESVLNQTYLDLELIILDDCSTDDSKKIIESYRGHPNVAHIIYNTVNSGSTFEQWKKGIELAKGEYIWIAESDDYAELNLLEVLYQNISKEDGCILSYAQSYRMNAAGIVQGTWHDQVRTFSDGYSYFSDYFICDGINFINRFLLDKNVIPNASAVLFKKEVYSRVGGIDLDIKACSDWLFWLKILTKGKVVFTPQVLNYFRFHEKSVIASVTKSDLLFLKSKFDIIARDRYNKFLINNDISILVDKNNLFIERDYIIDVFECYNKKSYGLMLKILFKAFINSKDKRYFILKLSKSLLKR